MDRTVQVKLSGPTTEYAPPGCDNDFVDHPNPARRGKECVEVSFVMEHRFAFHYWLRCKRKLLYDRASQEWIPDEDFRPPDLVTWDSHDDTADDGAALKTKLLKLNQADEREVALFCWMGLHFKNDGHISPAMWLNALGNVYVIQRQKESFQRERPLIDRYGKEHRLYFFRSHYDFAKTFERTRGNAGVIWDVDLDYFVKRANTSPVPLAAQEIAAALSPATAWMPLILRDLKAVTVALEPTYTGGLSRSLELFKQWQSALFCTPLFSKSCRWRKNVTRALK